jgi:hypothetical protein
MVAKARDGDVETDPEEVEQVAGKLRHLALRDVAAGITEARFRSMFGRYGRETCAAAVAFAEGRGWVIRAGRLYADGRTERVILAWNGGLKVRAS